MKLIELTISSSLVVTIVSILLSFILKLVSVSFNLLDRLDVLYNNIVIEQLIREDLNMASSLEVENNYRNRKKTTLIIHNNKQELNNKISYFVKNDQLYRDNFIRAEAIADKIVDLKLKVNTNLSVEKYTINIINKNNRILSIAKVVGRNKLNENEFG